MDAHTHSHSPERLEVIEVGRRRRWSKDEKLRIVTECLEGPRLVSETARRHGITRSQLMAWRRALQVERIAPEPVPRFVPAVVAPEPTPAAQISPRRRTARPPALGRMVIEVGRGRRLVVEGPVDAEALAHVLDVLDRR